MTSTPSGAAAVQRHAINSILLTLELFRARCFIFVRGVEDVFTGWQALLGASLSLPTRRGACTVGFRCNPAGGFMQSRQASPFRP